ncbi:MAG: SPOR domain-containing protein [Acidobacteriota bacterium]
MPNLNLRGGDTPDDMPEMQEIPESEQQGAPRGSALRRSLPLAAGAVVALLLAAYILNKTGIVHLWGNKQASSVVIMSVPADSSAAQQVVSDSAMAEQFRKDSLEALAQTAPKQETAARDRAITDIQKAAPERKTAAAAAVQPAPAKKEAQAPTAKPSEAPKQSALAKPENTAKRNPTTVEVPGAARHRAPSSEGAEYVAPAQKRTPVKPAASASAQAAGVKRGASPEAKQAAAERPAPAARQSEGAYTVQLSSWMSAQKAQAQAARFTSAGVPAFVSTEGHVHRVCTGRFATEDAARTRAEELVPMLESKYDIIMLK